MKPKLSIVSTLAATSLFTVAALEPQARAADAATTAPVDARRNDTLDSRRGVRTENVAKASDVIGMEVKNLQGEKLGKVENLVVDLETGRIIRVIVSSGGFLGIGDELSAVPPSAFRRDANQNILHLDMSKEALAQAPHFKPRDWPNFSDPTYDTGNYRTYGTRTDADAVGRSAAVQSNVGRDRDVTGLTASDQATNKRDVEITRQVRRDLRNQKGLSVNAQNVKIITVDGHITLRGPVNTDEERRLIGDIAARAAQNAPIDNQLEVTGK